MNQVNWQQLLQQGINAIQEQQATQALKLLREARQIQPNSRDIGYWLGNAQRMCGLAAEAEETYRTLLTADPADFDTAMALAFLLREQGHSQSVGELLLNFARQEAVQPDALLKLTGFLRDSNCFVAAIEVMNLLLERDSSQAANYFRLARLYQGTGQHDLALIAYRKSLQRDANLGGAWIGLATLQKFTDPSNPDWQLILNASDQSKPAEAAMCLAFARGKGFDDLEEYGQAWRHYVDGNRLRHLGQPWDAGAWQQFVLRELSKTFRPRDKSPSPRKPVFIVGMLRSGTTLLEQLLDQHPAVTARGELNFLAHAWARWQQASSTGQDAQELASQIWRHMKLEGEEDRFYIDKNPLNFRYLPLLAELMPEAKIIHVSRDGRDSCLSCFMQLFQHPDTAFSNQLDDLVEFYQGYLRLMQHFSRNMPSQILNLSYEDLVQNTGPALQKVQDFLGLPNEKAGLDPEREFGEQAGTQPGNEPGENAGILSELPGRPIRTASAWQARQKVHRKSLGRWQNYYVMAPEFFDRLKELDKELLPG